MKVDFNKINKVVSAKIEWHKYNDCFLNDIEFDEVTKNFIENIIIEYQDGIVEKKLNLFVNSNENDEFLKEILEKFPDKNNKFYNDIDSCIGDIHGITELINDIFKLKVCKNINID